MAYKIKIKRSAAKEIASLQKRDQRRIVAAIEALAENPRPAGVRKLANSDDVHRLRVGDFRVVYQIVDEILTVFVVRVGHRKDVYRQR